MVRVFLAPSVRTHLVGLRLALLDGARLEGQERHGRRSARRPAGAPTRERALIRRRCGEPVGHALQFRPRLEPPAAFLGALPPFLTQRLGQECHLHLELGDAVGAFLVALDLCPDQRYDPYAS